MFNRLPILLIFYLIALFTLSSPAFSWEVGETFQVKRSIFDPNQENLKLEVTGEDSTQYDDLKSQTNFKVNDAFPKLTMPKDQVQAMEEGKRILPPSNPTPSSEYNPDIAFPQKPTQMQIQMKECGYRTTGEIKANLPDWEYQEYLANRRFTEMFSKANINPNWDGTPYTAPQNKAGSCDELVSALGNPNLDGGAEGGVNLSNFQTGLSEIIRRVGRIWDEFEKKWNELLGRVGWTVEVPVQPIVSLGNEIGSIPELSYATGNRSKKLGQKGTVLAAVEGSGGNETDPDWSDPYMRIFFTPDMETKYEGNIQKIWTGEPLHAKAQVDYKVDGAPDQKDNPTEVRGQAGTKLAWNWTQCSLSFPNEGCVVSTEGGSGGSAGRTYIDIKSTTLKEIFKEAAEKIGVPVAMLKAIARIEAGRVFGYSDQEVSNFSTYGWWLGLTSEAPTLNGNDPLIIRGLGYNTCKYRNDCFSGADVRGVMQFEINTWRGIERQIDFGHQADRRVIPDAVVGAAKLIKNHALAKGETSASGWSEEVVKYVAGRYCGNPKSSACGGNYDNVVWAYYQQFLREE
jgi:hypothetical protein